MGHYTTDAAELARFNDGLPPDEQATILYVPSEAELRAETARDFWRRPLPPRRDPRA